MEHGRSSIAIPLQLVEGTLEHLILEIRLCSLVSPLHIKFLHTNDLLPSRIDSRDDAHSSHSSATSQMEVTAYQHNIFSTIRRCLDDRMLTLDEHVGTNVTSKLG